MVAELHNESTYIECLMVMSLLKEMPLCLPEAAARREV
jgi:hypothetical protein